MKPLLFCLVLALGFGKGEENHATHLTVEDLNLFFDSISYKNGAWAFKLSSHTAGMQCRVTAINSSCCEPGKILIVPPLTSFDLTTKDIGLFFHPVASADFKIRLVYTIKAGNSSNPEEREAFLSERGSKLELKYAKE